MEEKPVSLMKSSLIYGIYLGIVSILLSVVLYVMGYTFEQWVQYTGYVVLTVGIIWAQVAFKKALGGEMTYGQALGVGTMTVVFSSVLSGIYTYLLYTVIDPSLLDQLRIFTEQQMLERGVSEEQLDATIAITSKLQSPPIMAVMAVIGGGFLGLIISLITGIFTKKNPSNEVPA